MKKILILFFAVTLLAACGSQSENYLETEDYALTGEVEPDYVSVTESAQTETEVEEDETVSLPPCGLEDERAEITPLEPWQEAYAELLLHYSAVTAPMEDWVHWHFILHDVDIDGIPELMIVYISAGIWLESIYTFADGNIVQLEGDFFAYWGIYPPIDRPGIIIQTYGWTTLYVIADGALVAELILINPFHYDDAERWYINDIEVTEEEFAEMYNSIMPAWDGDLDNWGNIWPAGITDENIQDIIFGFESPH